MKRVALVVLAACWTGPEPASETIANSEPRAPLPALALDVTLERTECFGRCPSYVVEIHGDGSVAWTGRHYVAAIGPQRGRVDRRRVSELARAIDGVQFFELDDEGHFPKPACVRTGNTTSCSFTSVVICSDTSHAVVTVRRGDRQHTVDDAHCADEHAPLVGLEDLIDRIAGTEAWIGH